MAEVKKLVDIVWGYRLQTTKYANFKKKFAIKG